MLCRIISGRMLICCVEIRTIRTRTPPNPAEFNRHTRRDSTVGAWARYVRVLVVLVWTRHINIPPLRIVVKFHDFARG